MSEEVGLSWQVLPGVFNAGFGLVFVLYFLDNDERVVRSSELTRDRKRIFVQIFLFEGETTVVFFPM